MKRREFILLATAPGRLKAEQTAKGHRIAIVDPTLPIVEMSGGAQDPHDYRPFLEELRRLGYIEGRNLLIDRFSGEYHASHDHAEVAREVLRRNPDLIVTIGTASSLALKTETRTVPIVFLAVTDPVGSGLVSSLAKPGSNFTGFTEL